VDLEELIEREEGEHDSVQGQEQHYLERMQMQLHKREKTCSRLFVEDGMWDGVAMLEVVP
jgi:hypothetical protein